MFHIDLFVCLEQADGSNLNGSSVSKASATEDSEASLDAYIQMGMEAIKQYKTNVIDIQGKKSSMAIVSFTINNQDFVEVGVSGVTFQKNLIEEMKNANNFNEVLKKSKISEDTLKITSIAGQKIAFFAFKGRNNKRKWK